MNHRELEEQWENEEHFAFQGWDFSHIDGRWDCPNPPWDYRLVVNTYLKDTDILLDMGTGGGEVLLTIKHPYKLTYATEAYVPNLQMCQKVLSPLGITIAQTYTDDKLPFEAEYFDFIINRHESFDLSEVDRTLRHGGYFITQQVGNHNDKELSQKLNNFISHNPVHTMNNYVNSLMQMGYQIIETNEIHFPVKFFDVGALVYYAKIIVWGFPDFSVKTCFNKLCEYQKEIDNNGFIEGTGHRFILVAKKP